MSVWGDRLQIFLILMHSFTIKELLSEYLLIQNDQKKLIYESQPIKNE
jgi:hypothetical protein